MPEVDAFIGLDQLTQIAPIIQGLLAKERQELAENFVTPPITLPTNTFSNWSTASDTGYKMLEDENAVFTLKAEALMTSMLSLP